MAFTISGTLITQTAGTTDTSWDGLNGLAGVTRVSMGDGFLYYCPGVGIDIAGTVTIADPSKSTVIPYFLHVLGTGIYTSGSFAADGVTPKTSGIHFQAFGPNTQISDAIGGSGYGVAAGGKSTLIGGSYYVNGGITYINGAIIREYGVDKYAVKAYGAASLRVRAFASDVILRNTRHYDIAYDLFRMPTEFSAKAFGAEYLAQYVGASASGADARFVAYAPSNTDGTYDFDNYGYGWVELYNSVKGAALNVTTQNTVTANKDKHVVPLFQEINFKVTSLAGANIQNARFKTTDAPVNSPTATITTSGSLKTWDFRNPLSYTGTTDASGVAASVPILQVWWGASNTKNLRFPSSTATYQFRTFDYQTQYTAIVLGSDSAIAKGMALVPLTTAVTVTESVAAALTGITFTASGATGGSVVISASRTLQDLWNYYRAWICQFTNWDSTDTWTYSNGNLSMGGWSLSVDAGSALTKTAAIGSLSTTSTITVNGTTDVTYTDSTGTRVTIKERTDKLLSTYVTVNGTAVGGTTVDGTFIAGWVPMSALRTITVQPTDQIRIAASYYGSKPMIYNLLGSEVDKFTLSLDVEPAIDTTINTTTRDEIVASYGSLVNGSTIEVTINRTFKQYTPNEVVAGLAYYIVSKGFLIHSAVASANSANLYSMSAGTIVAYTPAYKIRMADLDANGNAIVPTINGYEVPLVIYYQNPSTGEKSTMTKLNSSGAFLGTAPWTQQQASIGDADKAAIAAKTTDSVWNATIAPVGQTPAKTFVVNTFTATNSLQGSVASLPTLNNIEASTVLAKESTLATRASQSSVNAIPTNPLITTDTRLDKLDAAISTRLASTAYTAPTTPPTAAQNATAVRTELATELGKVNSTDTKTDELHRIHGLNAAAPLVVTPTARTAGAINQTLTGDGVASTTVTRVP